MQIEGRTDRLTDLAERLQFLDRAAQFVGALAQLVKQSRILDRDHRLVGKGGDQSDLLVGERLDPLARQDQNADRRALAQ